MESHIEYILAAVLYTECCAGILVNVIILAAIVLKWKPLRSLQPYYKILSCLVISRSLHLFSVFYNFFRFVYYPWIVLDMVTIITLNFIIILLYYTNFWFATILCVFYCVKITSYNSKVFIFFKTKLSTVVPWLLLASLIISLSSSLSFVFCVFNLGLNNLPNGAMENMTVSDNGSFINLHKQLLLFLLGSFPPFLIFCVTTSLLLHSLWMHTRRMRSSGSGFQSPNLESLFCAVKSMSLFLVLQIIYFILTNMISSGRFSSDVWFLVNSIITCSPSFFHSLYIISSNSDLKKTCMSMIFTPIRCNNCKNCMLAM